MGQSQFIGRNDELSRLKLLLDKKSASLVVVRGRRRIGKSRLIEEFAKKFTFFQFTGLPIANETTAQSQRDEFARQLSIQTGLPEILADDWTKLFMVLGEKKKAGRIIGLFDEISWMGSKDPDFLGKLKTVWEIYFKKNNKLVFILCGSVSTWIEKNIINSTGFLGRISLYLTLTELPLYDCNKFLEAQSFKRSVYEKFKILSVTGGVPWYLEQIQSKLNADENIKNLSFRKDGMLVQEFDLIFHDLFLRRSEVYKKIVRILVAGPIEFDGIAKQLNYVNSGALSEYLNDLKHAGFISRDYTWHLLDEQASRLSHFRLSDNYLRFYLKYVEPKKHKILNNDFDPISMSALKQWDTIMGLQFENLVINNRKIIRESLGIKPEDVVADNPFFQRKTSRQPGCQIDYLIQTRFNTLFVCEVKFSQRVIGMDIVGEMQNKIARLSIPKGFACCPVLIHVNGIHEKVKESDYFVEVIDFGALLEGLSS